jgi:hypothetical protein
MAKHNESPSRVDSFKALEADKTVGEAHILWNPAVNGRTTQ